jgi:hypothetical protein
MRRRGDTTMNGAHTISRRATMGYLGAALATGVSAKWAASWGTAADADLHEIPLGCFVSEAPDDESGPAGILAAVALDPGPVGMTGVRAYVCNGADVAEWFTADLASNEFSLTAEAGATLEGSIGPAGITGRFRALSGAEQSFGLHSATGAEGLYYIARSVDGRMFGASEGGAGVSYAATDQGIRGAFVLPGGIVEPIELPAESIALDVQSEDVSATASYRAIVAGNGASLRIAGAMVDPRPPRRCRVIKRAVVLADGRRQEEFVTICNRWGQIRPGSGLIHRSSSAAIFSAATAGTCRLPRGAHVQGRLLAVCSKGKQPSAKRVTTDVDIRSVLQHKPAEKPRSSIEIVNDGGVQ